jgi:sialate O-acetylesterase
VVLCYIGTVLRACATAILLTVMIAASPTALEANPVLPYLFTDHMVLQRDKEISIWGTSDPGEKLVVTLASSSREIVASSNGHWEVVLPKMSVGGPFLLAVRGKTTITLKDIMVGEVWVASGQSNMTYGLSAALGGKEEVPSAIYPNVRFFTVPRRISLTPEHDTLPGAWQVCTPDTAKDFSAVAYFFALELYKKLDVPVGIILSAWPGTQGQEWTDHDSLANSANLQPILSRWESEPPAIKSISEQHIPFDLEFDDFELLPHHSGDAPKLLTDFHDGSSQTSTGGYWTFDWPDEPDATFDLVAPGRRGFGYAARVTGHFDGTQFPHLNAVFSANATPIDLSAFSGVRFWVRGNGQFQFQTIQPTIVDADNYSTGFLQADSEWKQLTIQFADLKQAGWGFWTDFTPSALTGFQIVILSRVGDPDRPPSGLYDGMISPLERYRIRGAIWYQGESNALSAFQYRTLLPAQIRGWRKAWGEGDFPFLIVQLPNYGGSPELGDSAWAELREAQLLTAKTVPNAGIAVTIDLGDPKDLHPPRKREVGERLARWALGTTYGQNVVYSGPLYESMQAQGNEIRIRFAHTGSGLEARAGGPLKGFSIAGADRKFHWADARVDGDTVVVSSPDVAAPVSVRYAWANSPDCNLYNKDGLPASPFRTDDWRGITADGQ